MKSERDIQRDILLRFGALPWLRIWRMNTGKAYGYSLVRAAVTLLLQKRIKEAIDAFKRMPLTTYGQSGAADIQGIIRMPDRFFHAAGLQPMGLGRFLAIEVKRPGETQSDEQVKWQAMVESMGGLYILATDVEDVQNKLWAEGYPA